MGVAAIEPLLSTKYAPPPPRTGIVDRPVLVSTLRDACSVVLVSAPPGYGKTTLVAGWLAAERCATAWVTLDESDDDPAVLLAYLAAAVVRAVPAIRSAAVAGASPLASPAASLAPMLNALDRLGRPLVVVLDDYHVVGNPAAHGVVAFLLTHLPRNVRAVICTRQDPPLPLARLRGRGQLTEIRAENLRFDGPDCGRFLRESMGLELTDSAVERLHARTEGWAAGLQLAGLSLRGREDIDAFVDAFDASDRYLFDYLTDEALAHQPPEMRGFLEATSVLHRLSGELCDALTGRSDGRATLAALDQANLFVTPLDDRRRWYRYHPLFAELVGSSLEPEREQRLHGTAAAWYGEHGMPNDAIRHWLAASDHEQAAHTMEATADIAIARGEFRTVMDWTDALPPAVLAAHPALVVTRAWAQFFSGEIAASEATLSRIDRSEQPAAGRHACLQAWFANRHDDPAALPLARGAVATIPETDPVFRSLAFTTLGEALVGDDAALATAAFGEAHRLAQVARHSTVADGTVYSLANAHLAAGRRRDAEDLCREALAEERTRFAELRVSLGVVHLSLGAALFEADELAQARQHIATGHEPCERAGLRITVLGAVEWQEVVGLHLAGESEAAWRRLDAVARESERHSLTRVASAMRLLAAELFLLEGDPPAALRRLDEVPPSFVQALGATRDRGRQTQARVFLGAGRIPEAIAGLDALRVEQRSRNRLGPLITTLVILAGAHERAGGARGAESALRDALTLAGEQDWRRPFLDPVFPIGHLLPAVRASAPSFVDEILRRHVAQLPSDSAAPRPSAAGREALVEPLSVRELEVLRLVAAGLSNDEIGRELYVSGGTAKWHVHNIIGKLGARDRLGVVVRARSLGLI